jgi:fido (protein-threonine AMPylation protein)/SAM-dependent methyltransferase
MEVLNEKSRLAAAAPVAQPAPDAREAAWEFRTSGDAAVPSLQNALEQRKDAFEGFMHEADFRNYPHLYADVYRLDSEGLARLAAAYLGEDVNNLDLSNPIHNVRFAGGHDRSTYFITFNRADGSRIEAVFYGTWPEQRRANSETLAACGIYNTYPLRTVEGIRGAMAPVVTGEQMEAHEPAAGRISFVNQRAVAENFIRNMARLARGRGIVFARIHPPDALLDRTTGNVTIIDHAFNMSQDIEDVDEEEFPQLSIAEIPPEVPAEAQDMFVDVGELTYLRNYLEEWDDLDRRREMIALFTEEYMAADATLKQNMPVIRERMERSVRQWGPGAEGRMAACMKLLGKGIAADPQVLLARTYTLLEEGGYEGLYPYCYDPYERIAEERERDAAFWAQARNSIPSETRPTAQAMLGDLRNRVQQIRLAGPSPLRVSASSTTIIVSNLARRDRLFEHAQSGKFMIFASVEQALEMTKTLMPHVESGQIPVVNFSHTPQEYGFDDAVLFVHCVGEDPAVRGILEGQGWRVEGWKPDWQTKIEGRLRVALRQAPRVALSSSETERLEAEYPPDRLRELVTDQRYLPERLRNDHLVEVILDLIDSERREQLDPIRQRTAVYHLWLFPDAIARIRRLIDQERQRQVAEPPTEAGPTAVQRANEDAIAIAPRPRKGTHNLELGCGNGRMSTVPLVATMPETAELFAVDIDEAAVQQAQELLSESPNVTVEQCDALEIGNRVDNESIDNAYAFNMIYMLGVGENQARAIGQVYDSLRPLGTFTFNMPLPIGMAEGYGQADKRVDAFYAMVMAKIGEKLEARGFAVGRRPSPEGHYSIFYPGAYRRMLEEAGFEVVRGRENDMNAITTHDTTLAELADGLREYPQAIVRRAMKETPIPDDIAAQVLDEACRETVASDEFRGVTTIQWQWITFVAKKRVTKPTAVTVASGLIKLVQPKAKKPPRAEPAAVAEADAAIGRAVAEADATIDRIVDEATRPEVAERPEAPTLAEARRFAELLTQAQTVIEADEQRGQDPTGATRLRRRIQQISGDDFFTQGGVGYLGASRGRMIVIGDLHGDMECLERILAQAGYDPERNRDLPPEEQVYLVFEGDYGDVGSHSFQVAMRTLELKVADPEHVILMGGNHDRDRPTEESWNVQEHTHRPFLFRELRDIDGIAELEEQLGKPLFDVWTDLANRLPTLVVTSNGGCLMHASPPSELTVEENLTEEVYGRFRQGFDDREGLLGIMGNDVLLDQLAWNPMRQPPQEHDEPNDSFSRIQPYLQWGYWVGTRGVAAFMTAVGGHYILRAHDRLAPVYETVCDGRVLTVISTDHRSPHHGYSQEDRIIGRYAEIDLNADYRQRRIDSEEVVHPVQFPATADFDSLRAMAGSLAREGILRVTGTRGGEDLQAVNAQLGNGRIRLAAGADLARAMDEGRIPIAIERLPEDFYQGAELMLHADGRIASVRLIARPRSELDAVIERDRRQLIEDRSEAFVQTMSNMLNTDRRGITLISPSYNAYQRFRLTECIATNDLLNPDVALTEEHVLALHRWILIEEDFAQAGRYREQSVAVAGAQLLTPAPEEVGQAMHDFIEWLNSEEAQQLSANEYAATAYMRLIGIHPFAEGNGRACRLLMNLLLMRRGELPVNLGTIGRSTRAGRIGDATAFDVQGFAQALAEAPKLPREPMAPRGGGIAPQHLQDMAGRATTPTELVELAVEVVKDAEPEPTLVDKILIITNTAPLLQDATHRVAFYRQCTLAMEPMARDPDNRYHPTIRTAAGIALALLKRKQQQRVQIVIPAFGGVSESVRTQVEDTLERMGKDADVTVATTRDRQQLTEDLRRRGGLGLIIDTPDADAIDEMLEPLVHELEVCSLLTNYPVLRTGKTGEATRDLILELKPGGRLERRITAENTQFVVSSLDVLALAGGDPHARYQFSDTARGLTPQTPAVAAIPAALLEQDPGLRTRIINRRMQMGMLEGEADPIHDVLVITNPAITTANLYGYLRALGVQDLFDAEHIILRQDIDDACAMLEVEPAQLIDELTIRRVIQNLASWSIPELAGRMPDDITVGFVGGQEGRELIAGLITGMLEGVPEGLRARYEETVERLANGGWLPDGFEDRMKASRDQLFAPSSLEFQRFEDEVEEYREQLRFELSA